MRENPTELPARAKPMNSASKIGLAMVGCQSLGALAALWTTPSVRAWLPTLILPPWTPSPAAFGALNVVFYALMGAALGVLWAGSHQSSREKRALIWFAAQLALLLAWSTVFFGMHSTGWAYGLVIMLWLCAAATLWLASKISRAAGWLLLPCVLWVTFLSTFNFAVLSLNFLKPAVLQMDNDKRNGPKDSKPGATLR